MATSLEELLKKHATPEMLRRLYEKHFLRYTGMLEAHRRGQPGYRPDELAQLLKIWNEIHDKGFDVTKVGEAAKHEIYDALEDEGILDEEEEQ